MALLLRLWQLAFLAWAGACHSGSPAGSPCSAHGDCAADLQCFQQICTASCNRHTDCGEGYTCEAGECLASESAVGTYCDGEWECGQGHTCLPTNSDDFSCQLERAGGNNLGASCSTDDQCRAGVCALGRCESVCNGDFHCRADQQCSQLATKTQTISACLPMAGHREVSLQKQPDGTFQFPAVSSASGIQFQMHGDTANEAVNPVQHINTADDQWHSISASQRVQTASAIYRFGHGNKLNLRFHAASLENHPCIDNDISASTWTQHEGLNDLARYLSETFQAAHIEIALESFDEIVHRPDLAYLKQEQLAHYLPYTQAGPGVDIFLVRSIVPQGIQVLTSARPGPLSLHDHQKAAIFVSMDTKCYRSWEQIGRQVSHQIARYLGLERTVSATSSQDSSLFLNNLLHYSEFGGRDLTSQQAQFLRRSVVLQ